MPLGYQCTSCGRIYKPEQVYDDGQGRFICHGCHSRHGAALATASTFNPADGGLAQLAAAAASGMAQSHKGGGYRPAPRKTGISPTIIVVAAAVLIIVVGWGWYAHQQNKPELLRQYEMRASHLETEAALRAGPMISARMAGPGDPYTYTETKNLEASCLSSDDQSELAELHRRIAEMKADGVQER